jgi:glycosyltransferase involved in cell wall biosynthesis
MTERIAVVVKGYPRLSETFIAQELLTLQLRGLGLAIYSLREPYDDKRHPVHDAIAAPVRYLPEYIYRGPLRVFRAWRHVHRLPGYAKAFRAFMRDLRRDLTPNRGRRFGQAMVLAHEMPPSVGWIYAHFLHTPASVARYAALMRGLPWSCSAHAKDIYTTPNWEKAEKIAEMEWLVTCTRANVAHLKAVANGAADRVGLLYHGIDLTRFPAPPRRPDRDGSDRNDPVVLLSVGRAVEKKGYDILLRALQLLPEDLHWRFAHVGGGELLQSLKLWAREMGLADRIEWRGSKSQEDVIAAYRAADVFVLASRIARNGDRDGLPNVLMEAQSQGLACLSTAVSGVPEVIADGVTGLLVPPEEPTLLAEALRRLIVSPGLRVALGATAARAVREQFSHHDIVGDLAQRFVVSRGART